MGNLLNPSLKGVHLKLVDKFEETKRQMEEMLVEDGAEMGTPMEQEKDDDEPPAKISATEMLKRKIRNEEEKKGGARMSDVFSEPQSKFEKEWSCYELLPDADSGVDQLLWWKMHETQFPLLSHMARIVFAFSSSELEVGESFQCRWEHCDSEEGLPGAKQGGALGHN